MFILLLVMIFIMPMHQFYSPFTILEINERVLKNNNKFNHQVDRVKPSPGVSKNQEASLSADPLAG